MSDKVGPFRRDGGLREALDDLVGLGGALGDDPVMSSSGGYDPVLVDWLDLRNMLLVAAAVTCPALSRTESRGAHQREDHPSLSDDWHLNQIVALAGGALTVTASDKRIAA
jgi:succinate dehydrogenase / fumarate reductase, flavoprotein subunit